MRKPHVDPNYAAGRFAAREAEHGRLGDEAYRLQALAAFDKGMVVFQPWMAGARQGVVDAWEEQCRNPRVVYLPARQAAAP